MLILLLGSKFICEAQLSDCLADTQFEFFNENLTFFESQESCKKEEKSLVTILNKETNLFLIEFLKSIEASATWIGLTREPPSDSLDAASFFFVTGENISEIGSKSGINPWGEGDPNINENATTTCVVVDITEVWFDGFCDEKFTYLCERMH